MQSPGMHLRIADAIRRGKVVCQSYGIDLFEVDYHDLAGRPVAEVREMLGVPPKGPRSRRGRVGRALRSRGHVRDPAASRSRNVSPVPARVATSSHVTLSYIATVWRERPASAR